MQVEVLNVILLMRIAWPGMTHAPALRLVNVRT